jgi:hypothetical protein
MFDINKINPSKILMILVVIAIVFLLYYYLDTRDKLSKVSNQLIKMENTLLVNQQQNNLLPPINNNTLINNVPYNNNLSSLYQCNTNNSCYNSTPINIPIQTIHTYDVSNVLQTNQIDKSIINVKTLPYDGEICNKNIKQDCNLILPINEIDGSEYSEIENDIKINSVCNDVQQNNKYDDDNSDGDDELIFNNGYRDVPHYGTIKDSELKIQLHQLKNDLESEKRPLNDINSETPNINTEYIKQNNNLLNTFVSGILNNITKTNNLIDSDIANDNNNDNPNNYELKEEHVGSIVDIDSFKLNENKISINIAPTIKIDELLSNDICQSDTKTNNLNVEIINTNMTDLTDGDEKNKLHEKYSKLNLETLKLLCTERNIKLSINKTQKKKKDIINDLIDYGLKNKHMLNN